MRRRLAALAAVGLVAAALVAVGVVVGLVGVAAPLRPEFPTSAGNLAVPGREVSEKAALVGNFERLGFERGPGVVPPAATMSPVASPSPTGSAPTSSGPDLRFVLIGIGCILFAIVITVRARREGRTERGWF
jgi:hypothetical protein